MCSLVFNPELSAYANAHPDATSTEIYAFVHAFVRQLLGAHLSQASPAHIHSFVCELTAANIDSDLLLTEPFATSPRPVISDHTASIDGFFYAHGEHPFSTEDPNSDPE
jgi:hypothetical protein